MLDTLLIPSYKGHSWKKSWSSSKNPTSKHIKTLIKYAFPIKYAHAFDSWPESFIAINQVSTFIPNTDKIELDKFCQFHAWSKISIKCPNFKITRLSTGAKLAAQLPDWVCYAGVDKLRGWARCLKGLDKTGLRYKIRKLRIILSIWFENQKTFGKNSMPFGNLHLFPHNFLRTRYFI